MNLFEDIRMVAEMALELTRPDWVDIGGEEVGDLDWMADHITALLSIRILAIVFATQETNVQQQPTMGGTYSTSNICQFILSTPPQIVTWPLPITNSVLHQLRLFVVTILKGYRYVCYHRAEHAYHVLLSANKLLDLIMHPKGISRGSIQRTYGLRQDTLAQFALLFSALIHDVDHSGVSNRQLITEGDSMALLYNDQSVAENRSLSLAFSLFMADSNKDLRSVLFAPNIHTESREKSDEVTKYRNFRKLVIDLVLTTDIASPERVQIVKSKWTEAFSLDYSPIGTSTMVTSSVAPMTISESEKATTIHSHPEDEPSFLSKESYKIEIGHETNSDSFSKSAPPHSYLKHRGSYLPKSPSLVDEFFNARASSITTTSRGNSKELFMNMTEDLTDKNNITVPDLSDSTMDDYGRSTDEHRGNHIDTNLSSDSVTNPSTKHPLDISRHHRRYSMPTVLTSNKIHRFRLGICRALDLTGNPIEAFSLPSSNYGLPESKKPSTAPSAGDNPLDRSSSFLQSFYSLRTPILTHGHLLETSHSDDPSKIDSEMISLKGLSESSTAHQPTIDDEPNDLKAQVVLEQLMKAADVASLMQRWETMIKWAMNLFREQMTCFGAGRGYDARMGWFDNQLTFFESYVIPLGHRLFECKAFQDDIGRIFMISAERNRNRWLTEGSALSAKMIIDWEQR